MSYKKNLWDKIMGLVDDFGEAQFNFGNEQNESNGLAVDKARRKVRYAIGRLFDEIEFNEDPKKFIVEFNKNKVSDEFLDSCKKAGNLFEKQKEKSSGSNVG